MFHAPSDLSEKALTKLLDHVMSAGLDASKPETTPSFDELLGNLIGNLLDGKSSGTGAPVEKPVSASCPSEYEIQETSTHIVVYVDLPGVKKNDITVTCDTAKDGKMVIYIVADRKSTDIVSNVIKSTVRYGMRALTIPLHKSALDTDLVAKHDGGILSISIPKTKRDEQKPKVIVVE